MNKAEIEEDNIEGWGHNDIPFYGGESRTISLVGPIETDTATRFISQLFQLNSEDTTQPIFVHLNTEGGSVPDAMAIYDAMKIVESPIIMMVLGACMSAGLVILQAADLRLSSKNSLFFYHQMIMSDIQVWNGETAESISEYYKAGQDAYDEKIKTRSKIKKSVWAKEFAGKVAKFFSADDAKEFGIIDAIIKEAKKPKIKMEEKL